MTVSVENPRSINPSTASATTILPPIPRKFAKPNCRRFGRRQSGDRYTGPLCLGDRAEVHPLLAEPSQGDIDAVFKGFKDLAPKPWAQHFREMQAAGGSIEIKRLRLERPELDYRWCRRVDPQAGRQGRRLDPVAISGVENIVPLFGIDRAISRLSAGCPGKGHIAGP